MAKQIFNQTLANFYVRDPRTRTRTVNGFYNDNNQVPTIGGLPYVPGGYNPNKPVANGLTYGQLTGYSNSYAPVLGKPTYAGVPYTSVNTEPSTGRYANPASVFGLKPNTNTADSAQGYSFIAKQTFSDPVTASNASSVNRRTSSNLPAGADYRNQFTLDSQTSSLGADMGEDTRVFVSDPSGKILAAGGIILAPLSTTNGVIFPYTPTITFNHKANYESESLVHTNYDMPVYKNSTVNEIGVQAKFTANDWSEAQYVMAVIHFFRSATKMFYGQSAIAGTPPVVLRLDGHGKYLLNHLPVVCTGAEYSLPEEVDYVSTVPYDRNGASAAGSNPTMIPSVLQLNLSFRLLYPRNRLANEFGLEKFASGQLLQNGKKGTGGPGGYI